MARYKNGINGAFNGKVGTVVGVMWRGIDFMRSLPSESSVPPSEAQLNQRKILAMVSSWLKPLKETVRVGFQLLSGTKTPMNLAVSFMLKNALIGNGADTKIDFKKVVFSQGLLLNAMVTEMMFLGNTSLLIKWENASASGLNNNDDQVVFILYNEARAQFLTFNNVAQRSDKQVVLQLPAAFVTSEMHGYMHFVNTGKNAVSSTVYLGNLVGVFGVNI